MTKYGNRIYDAEIKQTFRYVYDTDTGRCIGRLYDGASEAALAGDIAPTSKPGKGSAPVLADGGATILNFSDYCARHLLQSYPHTTRRPQ